MRRNWFEHGNTDIVWQPHHSIKPIRHEEEHTEAGVLYSGAYKNDSPRRNWAVEVVSANLTALAYTPLTPEERTEYLEIVAERHAAPYQEFWVLAASAAEALSLAAKYAEEHTMEPTSVSLIP